MRSDKIGPHVRFDKIDRYAVSREVHHRESQLASLVILLGRLAEPAERLVGISSYALTGRIHLAKPCLGFRISLIGCAREPSYRFTVILRYAEPDSVHVTQTGLRHDDVLPCGLQIPIRSLIIAFGNTKSILTHVAELRFGHRVSLVGGAAHPDNSFTVVLFDALAEEKGRSNEPLGSCMVKSQFCCKRGGPGQAAVMRLRTSNPSALRAWM